MKKIFDYAGNEIKEGDEFVIIKVINRQFFRAAFFVPAAISKSGKCEEIIQPEIPDEDCWEPEEYYKVIIVGNELGYFFTKKGDDCTYDCYNTLQLMIAYSTLADTYPTGILAIKGISDTKEYYEKWKQQQSKSHAPEVLIR